MILTHQRAFELSRRLTTIDGCPRIDEALDSLADDLIEICSSEEEAETLVKEARWTWKKWQGTAGLIELLNSKRRPVTLPRERQKAELGPRPQIACHACNDNGIIREAGRHEWCTCAQGRKMREDMPAWLETLNRTIFGKLPEAKERRITSEAELEKEFQANQARYDKIIADARAILEDPNTPPNRREIARETIKSLTHDEEI